ncbi:MAG: hypothetical protein ACTSRG_22915 [Candidatus Helarchaeota archaeon]
MKKQKLNVKKERVYSYRARRRRRGGYRLVNQNDEDQIKELILSILKKESPIEEKLLYKRMLSIFDIRTNKSIKESFFCVLNSLHGKIHVYGNTISLTPIKQFINPRVSTEKQRPFELIPKEELAGAIKIILENSFTMSLDALLNAVIKEVYEYHRITDKIQFKLNSVIDYLIKIELIEIQNELVHLKGLDAVSITSESSIKSIDSKFASKYELYQVARLMAKKVKKSKGKRIYEPRKYSIIDERKILHYEPHRKYKTELFYNASEKMKIKNQILAVLEVESPIDIALLSDRVKKSFGIRTDELFDSTFNDCISELKNQGKIMINQDTISDSPIEVISLFRISTEKQRPYHLIPKEEIASIIRDLIKDKKSLSKTELLNEIKTFFKLKKATKLFKERIFSSIEHLIANNEVRSVNRRLFLKLSKN